MYRRNKARIYFIDMSVFNPYKQRTQFNTQSCVYDMSVNHLEGREKNMFLLFNIVVDICLCFRVIDSDERNLYFSINKTTSNWNNKIAVVLPIERLL